MSMRMLQSDPKRYASPAGLFLIHLEFLIINVKVRAGLSGISYFSRSLIYYAVVPNPD